MGSESTWEGELAISIAGLESVGLGKIHLVKLEESQSKTVRICPQCGSIPRTNKMPPMYHCEKCNKDYNTWHSLKQGIPVDEKTGIGIPERTTAKVSKASVSLLDLKKAYGLVTKCEYGVIAMDEKAKANMQRLGAMIKEFKKAIVFELVFMAKGERHLFYITVADDNTLRAREIVPMNKVRQFPKEIEVFVEDSKISGAELKQLMSSIPKIQPENLTLETEIDKLEKKIAKATPEIEQIMERMKEE